MEWLQLRKSNCAFLFLLILCLVLIGADLNAQLCIKVNETPGACRGLEFDDDSNEGSLSMLQQKAAIKLQVNEGQSASFCDTNAGGSCYIWPCSQSRGPTDCSGGTCRCKPGYCISNGVCTPRSTGGAMLSPEEARDLQEQQRTTCSRATGGSCYLSRGCYDYRGPTECVWGKCMCQQGYCSNDDGNCYKALSNFNAEVVEVHAGKTTFPGRHNQLRTAIAFSGGGSRALSVTLGALRALESLNLMSHVDAISSVSGGTWASSIYMFAPRSKQDILGSPTTPQQLTLEVLSRPPPALGAVATTNIIKVAYDLYFNKRSNPHNLWIEVYAKAVLEPFGIGNRSQYMATDNESVQRILRRNPQLQQDDFLVQQPDRPKNFIMGGTILSPVGHVANDENAVNLQMSPDFTGSPFYPKDKLSVYHDIGERLIGGGFVETFAFGGDGPLRQLQAPSQAGGTIFEMQAPAEPFSLARAVGISSAAFASEIDKVLDASAMSIVGGAARKLIPLEDIWPIASQKFPKQQSALKYEVGDGGLTDNCGLIALLQRRVPRIVSFISTDVALSQDVDFCSTNFQQIDLRGKVTTSLLDKFGKAYPSAGGEFLENNQVFKSSELQPLLCDFQHLRIAKRPLVVQKKLQVIANAKWGTEGSWYATIIFVYLSPADSFVEQLPRETRKEILLDGKGWFNHFPNYNTAFQNSGRFTSYSNEQVNLLAAFSEFMVRENAKLFQDL